MDLLREVAVAPDRACIIVTHDNRIFDLADRILVMHRGRIVEGGESIALLADPQHPYTRMLVGAVPDPDRVGSFDAAERASLREQIATWTSAPDLVHRTIDPASGHWVLAPKEDR